MLSKSYSLPQFRKNLEDLCPMMITFFSFWKFVTKNAMYHEYLIAEELLIMTEQKGCV